MLGATVLALYGGSYLPQEFLDTLVQNGLYAPLFAALIVVIAKSRPMAFSSPSLVRLGEASYAIYIIHIPIWGMFNFADRSGMLDVRTPAVYVAYLAVVVLGSLLIFRFVETPCRNFVRIALRKRAQHAAFAPVRAHSS